jgi:hypothetical protein
MAAYQEYRDEEVSSILIDEELSEKGKLLRIKNHYKARLFSSGRTSQAIQFVEKEIREEILYEQKRIQTAFNNLSFSRNEANENLAMGNISLMREALGYALAEIANEITRDGIVDISTREQHEFNEAKKTGHEVDEIKGIHADQLKKAEEFHDEAKSWGLLLWGGFILLIVGVYVYMYSPVIIQAIYSIGQNGSEEAKRTQNVVATLVYVFGGVLIIGGLGVLFQAGIQSIAYPFALMGWVVKWGSLRKSLRKTQSYNGEAKKQAGRALLWAISPTFLFLGIAAYYIFQPLAARRESPPVTTPTRTNNSFQPNALTNRNEPIRDANNETANIIETLPINTPIFIVNPAQKRRWFEVQTPSGKSGWIDGWGYRLASSSEIASFTSETNANSSMANSNSSETANSNSLSVQPSNLSQSSDSSEVATATPYSNPLIETPRPIENPEQVYREFRVSLINNTKSQAQGGQLLNMIPRSETNNPFDFNAIQERLSPIDAPLKSIIFNGDEEILSNFGKCSSSYYNAFHAEMITLHAEYSYIASNKYQEIQISINHEPERGEYLSRGLKVFDRRVPQFIQTIKTVSAA